MVRTPLLFFPFVLVLPAVSAGCGGKDLDVGYDDSAVANVNPAAPVDMNAVRARCGAAGTDAPFDFSAPASAVLAGRWFLCDAAAPDVPAALELTAEGAWSALAPNDSGVYVRDEARAGVYVTAKDISCCYPDTLVLSFGTALDSPGYFVTFRRGPQQMLWSPRSSHGGDPRPIVARFVRG
jgi:hypothetical protein